MTVTRLITWLHTAVLARTSDLLADRRRGATFLEYMLLAAIAVAIFWLVRALLGDGFDGVIDRIREALSF